MVHGENIWYSSVLENEIKEENKNDLFSGLGPLN